MAFEGEDAKRWAVVTAPALHPAADFITRTTNGPFIDTGLNVTFEMRGRVYLAVETIKEMAEIAGLLETKTAQEKTVYDTSIFNKGFEAGLMEGTDLNGKLDSILSRISGNSGSVPVPSADSGETGPTPAGRKSGKPAGDSGDV